MQLNKAPSLESLCIQLYCYYPVDANVEYWVTYAVKRHVRELNLKFSRLKILPTCLYTSKTLVILKLYNNVLVDVPSLPSLPFLQTLILDDVLYKDQDSHVQLLSSCPVLKHLHVIRTRPDNVTSFIVKVPSLERLMYVIFDVRGTSVVIDSPGLHYLKVIASPSCKHNCSIQNMRSLDVVDLHIHVGSPPNDNFLTSFSSVISLNLSLTKIAYCSAINFSRLIELKLSPNISVSYSLDALMLLHHNAPKLKVLMIDSDYSYLTLPWNQPSSVRVCLLCHLEVFEWKSYPGRREENEMVAYILRNSKCLKTVGICLESSYSDEKKQKMTDELKSMYRVSSSSRLLFAAKMNYRYRE